MNKNKKLSLIVLLSLSGCANTQPEIVKKRDTDYKVSVNKVASKAEFQDENDVTSESIDKQLDHIEPGRYFSRKNSADSFLIFDSLKINDIQSNEYQGLVASYNSISSTGFAVNSAELNPLIKPHLVSIKNLYKNYQRFNGEKSYIIITGHTDSSGSREYNKQLARDRADSAARFLIKSGVPSDALLRMAAGQDYPIAPNNSLENKAKNRRVEFFISHDTNFVSKYYRSAPCYTTHCDSRTLQAVGYTREGKVITESRNIPTELKQVRDFNTESLEKSRTSSMPKIRYRKLSIPSARS